MEWSPDGSRLSTTSADGTTRIWDLATGSPLHVLQTPGVVQQMRWSPDGRWLATTTRLGEVELWDPASGRRVHRLPDDNEWSVGLRFLPDGRLVTATPAGDVLLIDPDTGAVEATLKGHSHYVFGTAVSADGARLATVSVDQTARIWDLDSLTQVHVLPHPIQLRKVHFGDDGRRLLTTGHSTRSAWIWDTETGELVAELEAHTRVLGHIDVSPDGHTFLTSGHDRRVRLWNARDGTLQRQLPPLNGLGTTAWHPSGRVLSVSTPSEAFALYDPRSGALVGAPDGIGPARPGARFSSDGSRFAEGYTDGRVVVRELPSLPASTSTPCDRSGVLDWRVSPSRKLLAIAPASGGFCVVPADGGPPLIQEKGPASWLAWTPPRDDLLIGSDQQRGLPVQLWSARTGTLLTLPDNITPIDNLMVDPLGGDWWGISPQKQLQRIDAHTREVVETFDTGNEILLAKVEGDVARIVHHDRSVEFWNLKSGELLHRKLTTSATITSFGLSGDGTWGVWEEPPGVLRRVPLTKGGIAWDVPIPSPLHAVKMEWGQRVLSTYSQDRLVRFYDAQTGAFLRSFPVDDQPISNWVDRTGSLFGLLERTGELTVRRMVDGVPVLRIPPGAAGEVMGVTPLGTELITMSHDGVARRWDVPSEPAALGRLSNLRACLNGDVVPVLPWPSEDSIWAPDALCGGATDL